MVRSFACPNCCQTQYSIGSESLHKLEVDIYYIYLKKLSLIRPQMKEI